MEIKKKKKKKQKSSKPPEAEASLEQTMVVQDIDDKDSMTVSLAQYLSSPRDEEVTGAHAPVSFEAKEASSQQKVWTVAMYRQQEMPMG